MKFLYPIVSGCIAFAPWVSAQVSVDLALDQDQFLPGESLVVGVRITNFSGQTLHLGKDSDWLHITLEGRDNYVVPTTADLPVQGEFDVESSKIVTRRVDVAPCFALTKPGRYMVRATVKLKDWDSELVSKPKAFDIIAGTILWEQDVGVSAPAANHQPPEVRKYALQQAIHLRRMKLYVSDRPSRVACLPDVSDRAVDLLQQPGTSNRQIEQSSCPLSDRREEFQLLGCQSRR